MKRFFYHKEVQYEDRNAEYIRDLNDQIEILECELKKRTGTVTKFKWGDTIPMSTVRWRSCSLT